MPRNLDTIVVTASRSEEKLKNVPARISMIEPQILEQSPIASLPDLLMTMLRLIWCKVVAMDKQHLFFTWR
jgi:outer membrane cobalamin receptor